MKKLLLFIFLVFLVACSGDSEKNNEKKCPNECKTWEQCDLSTLTCVVKDGNCNSNSDCTNQGEICNTTTNLCVTDCVDVDSDGYGRGTSCLGLDCNDTDTPFGKNNWISCETCVDKDDDGKYTGCDKYSDTLVYDEDDNPPTPYDLAIIIKEEVKTNIQTELNEYINLLSLQNIDARIIIFNKTTVEELKELIKEEAIQRNIDGAFLIGDLPTAFYEMDCDWGEPYGIVHEDWPMDIFLMDLDSTWEDADKNGIYDSHSQLVVTIFTSRLNGTEEEIKTYLTKINNYRKNGSDINKAAFIFKDDDWRDFYPDYDWGLDGIYNDFIKLETLDDTTKANYVQKLTTEGAEFVYQWIHSDPDMLYFGENFGGDYLTRDEIKELDIKGSFYNLFDCSASRFTQENLAKTYLLTHYGLATIGSTKTGGIYNPETFHSILAQGKTWGEAYRNWYNNAGVYDDSWFGGIMIQGDPMLTISKDTQKQIKNVKPIAYSEKDVKNLKRKFYQNVNLNNVKSFEDYKKENPQFFK